LNGEVQYRLIRPEDSAALERLVAACPDTGRINFTYAYQADLLAVHRALAENLQGVVAVVEGEIVGMVFGDIVQVQWGGKDRQGVYVHDLRVHPDFRRSGVARGLAEWGRWYLEERFGGNMLLYAAIQEGNVSLGLAERYGFQTTQVIEGSVIPMRRTPPKPKEGLVVRAAEEGDLAVIGREMNRYYQDHDLWSPTTPASVWEFQNREVAGVHPNQFYVVTRGDEIVGGLSLSDRTRLVRMKVAHTRGYVRLLGRMLGILDRDGEMRALTVRRFWFVEGELEAGRYLWERLRYELRERGNCLGVAYDPRDQLKDVFKVPPWLPKVRALYLVRAGVSGDPARRIYCVAGA
jgi:ribosomal protein S18 acetylase RimI-like enzyme